VNNHRFSTKFLHDRVPEFVGLNSVVFGQSVGIRIEEPD